MQSKRQARGGSALIIVLGFLSILLLIVFAFAVKMQTEYRVARSAESNVRTEFVMVQGIHLTALEVGHPVFRPGLSISPISPWYYPRREVFDSQNILVGDLSRGLITNYLASPADLFVPSAVYNEAMLVAQSNYFGILPQSYGGSVPDPLDRCDDDELSEIVAVYFEPSGVAYCVLNNSGYLDINAPYGTTTRGYGTNVTEIKLTDVTTTTPAQLTAGRNALGRIESMMELYAYSSEFGLSGPDMTNFGTYSHCPLGQYWNTNSEKLVNAFPITGDVAYVQANVTDVRDAFTRAGFKQEIDIGTQTVNNADFLTWLSSNLVDYIDTDIRPWDPLLESPNQEPVPAINEIVVRTTLQCTCNIGPPSTTNFVYNLGVSVAVELWRAFVNPGNVVCRLILDRSQVVVTPTGAPGLPPATGSGTYNPMASISMGPRSFVVKTPVTNIGTTVTSPTFVSNITYQITIPSFEVRNSDSTIPYDKILAGTHSLAATLPPFPPAPFNGQVVSVVTSASFQCIDPRFNWNPYNLWVQFQTDTTGMVNQATVDFLTNANNNVDYMPGDSISNATSMYAKNSLPLNTVGELGYIVVAPWRTIRLTRGIYTNQNVEPVVDTFSLKPARTVERGLINPNTCFTGVLQAAFNGAYMDLYPGEPLIGAGGTCSNLSSGHAAMLATAMLMHTYRTNSTEYAATSTNGLLCGLLNVSQLGEITNIFHNAWLTNSLGADCEFRREAIVRNSVGLFSTRNLLYTTVLIVSDEIDGGGGNDFPIRNSSRMGAEHLAVATVVRDPWSKELFIRHFRYLPSDGVLKNY